MDVLSLLPRAFAGAPPWNPQVDQPTPTETRLLRPLAGRRANALRLTSLRVAAPDPVRAARVVAQRALESAAAPYYAAALGDVVRFSVPGVVRTIDHARGIAPQVAEFDMLLGEVLGRGTLAPLLADMLLREFNSRHFAARVRAASAVLVLAVTLPEATP
jgi:hypothetical protein